jgi:hypothetical protein
VEVVVVVDVMVIVVVVLVVVVVILVGGKMAGLGVDVLVEEGVVCAVVLAVVGCDTCKRDVLIEGRVERVDKFDFCCK